MRTKTSPNHTLIQRTTAWQGFSFLLLSVMLLTWGCAKDPDVTMKDVDTTSSPTPTGELGFRANTEYKQVNLVANTDQYDAAVVDEDLVNAWGLAISPAQDFWVTSTGSDFAMVYDYQGGSNKPALDLEGEPIGIVYNSTTSFKMPGSTNIARYIFATDDGKIAAWTPWNTDEITVVVDHSVGGGTGYTGVEIAKHKTNWFIYAANVKNGSIDVYDKNFQAVTTMSFSDPTLPDGARPFNIRLINSKLYVTYVGPGGGYVNVFNTDGTFVKRFASGGTLQAPWGITKVPASFGLGSAILVGNFGDGHINIYNYAGQYLGQLNDDSGNPVAIDGLWALSFVNPDMNGHSYNSKLYFTAGPNEEADGLFGYLELQ